MKRFPFIDGSLARGLRAVGGDLDAVVFAMRRDAAIGAENRVSAELHKQPRSPRARSRDLRGAETMFGARTLIAAAVAFAPVAARLHCRHFLEVKH
jgi:hypothetical protein